MDTTIYQNPIAGCVDEAPVKFGVEMLERYDGIRQDLATLGNSDVSILERVRVIKDAIRVEGIPGIISLLQALLADGPSRGDHLIKVAKELCHPDEIETFRTYLAALEGACPKTCLWTVDDRFTYSLHSNRAPVADPHL